MNVIPERIIFVSRGITVLLCSTQSHIDAGLCTTVWMTSNMARWVTIGPHSAVLSCIAVICKIKIESIVQNYGPGIPYYVRSVKSSRILQT